ncbi:MAG: SurA N-terminal domain-containing protein, partial [Rhizomicrobium sp.]
CHVHLPPIVCSTLFRLMRVVSADSGGSIWGQIHHLFLHPIPLWPAPLLLAVAHAHPYHPPLFAAKDSVFMLQQMRQLSKSWISSIFLGGLALSFGVWGIADIFRGNTDTSIATIGGEKIEPDVFQRDYRNFLRGEGSQLGHEISPEEARATGLDRQALETMLSRSAIDQVVASYGLRATDAQVSSAIRAITAFRGPLGSFDHQTFLYKIQNAGFTEDSFVADERQDIARNQLLVAVHAGFALPPGYTRLLFDYVAQHRAANYIVVPRSAAGTPPQPGDAELTAYIRAHATQFSTPEYRDVTYAVAAPQDVMSQVHVTDDELRQQYELRKDQYQIPEKRDVEQITFPDEASAKAARAKIDAGTTFDQLAFQRRLKSTDISLGSVVEADLGKDRGPATFALPAGGVTQPLKSTFGWVLLHVTKITPGVNKSFADVKDSLRKDVLNQLATAKLTDVSNAFDDASAGGASLANAARRAGMRVIHVSAVDKNGLTPEGTKADLPASPDFLAQLQKSEVGEEGDPFPSTDGSLYVIKVNGMTPPKLRPLAAVRAEAVAAWTANWEKDRLSTMAQQLVEEATAAKSLSGIAAKLHATVESTGALTRNASPAGLPPELVTSLFNSPPGEVVSAPAANGEGLVIARATGVAQPPSPTANPQFFRFASSLSGGAADDFVSTLAMAARARLGVTINQSQVDRITGGGS